MFIPRIFTDSNPLDCLTEGRLRCLLLAGQQGDLPELQWLYYFVEKRNATVRAVKRKLSNSLLKLDWDIRVREDLRPEQEQLAEQQRVALRTAYDHIENLRLALEHLALADLRGFAHCERIYAGGLKAPVPAQGVPGTPEYQPEIPGDPRYIAGSWEVVELRCVEPWLWTRDGCTWRYNREGLSGLRQGTALAQPARDWVIREVTDPANEIFARAHLDMLLTLDDWAEHNDRLAVAPLFVEGPPNASREQEREFQETAEKVVSAGSGYLPNGAKPHLLSLQGAHEAFLARLEYWRKEIVLTGTNGLLTMLAESGSGNLAGGAHSDSWMEVAAGLAAMVSQTLQAQFDGPLLRRLFPGQPHLVYFEFAAVEEQDVKAHCDNASTLNTAGYRIDAEELSEKTGYKISDAVAPSSQTSTPKPDAPGSQPGGAAAAVTGGGPIQPAASPAPVVAPPVVAPPEVKPPIARPSRAGEAQPEIVQAALANFVGLEEKWLAPAAPLLARMEAALADESLSAEELEQVLQEIHESLPALLPKLGIADLAQALAEAGAPAAIQGTVDALAAKTPKSALKTAV